MAVQNQLSVRPLGPNWRFEKYPEAASQSFLAGEFVKLVSGKATVCADDETTIAGIAMEAASGTTDTDILIAVPSAGARMVSSVYHSTAASAITAVTQPTTRYGLQVESNKHYIDIEDTSNLAFLARKIVLPAGHKVGDQYGQLEFEILDEVNQLSGRDNA